jgi:hypothetical protein
MADNAAPIGLALGADRTFRLGRVFRNAFGMFGRNAVAFLTIAALVLGPFYLVLLATVVLRPTGTLSGLVVNLTVIPMLVICPMIASGAMTYGVAQDLRGRPVRMLDMLNLLLRRFRPIIGVAMSLLPLLLVSMMLAVIVGGATGILFPSISREPRYLIALLIVFLILGHSIWFAAAPVCMAEQVGIRASLSRGRFLTKGYRWQIFGAFVLIVIVDVFISVMARMVVTQIGTDAGLIGGDVERLVASYIVQTAFLAFVAVVAAVFYQQLRVAKGGSDVASVFD